MRRLTLSLAILAILAMTIPGSALAGHRGSATCVDGSIGTGVWTDLKITGVCTIDDGAVVRVRHNLIIARGAILNDHAASTAEVHVGRNIRVRKGGVLGLGYNAPEGTLGPDTVGGSIVAHKAATLYVGNVAVGRNLISIGGGDPGRNLPIKDNVIGGNVVVVGWSGLWFGIIRNTIGRNVVVVHNRAVDPSTLPGSDSTEIMGSAVDGMSLPQTIGGNLICRHNVPAAQVNVDDLGANNQVAGRAIGECSGLAD